MWPQVKCPITITTKMISISIRVDVATGEVPNLFPADEKAEILERVQNTAREEGR